MSTWWYFECHSHDPIIRSSSEFTQHTNDEHYKMALKLANSRPLEMDLDGMRFKDEASEHFGRNMIWFLQQHPNCDLKIIDEYGKREDIPPQPVTVADLINRLAKFKQDMLVEVRGRQGDAVLVVRKKVDDSREDTDELYILFNGIKGETLMAKE